MARTKSELKRKAILEAASKLFAEHGYHQVTVAQIADAIGMGLGTFYRYFKNKLDVFHSVIEGVLNEVAQRVLAEVPTESTSLPEYRAQVERIGMSLFEAFGSNRRLARLLFVEAPGIDSALNATLLESVIFFGQLTQAYLENGVSRGFLRKDLDAETTGLAINAMIFEGGRHIALAPRVAVAQARWSKAIISLMFSGMPAR